MIKEQKLENLYALTGDEVKKHQSKEDFITYYDLCNKYFGRPKKYGQTSFSIMDNPMGKGKVISATLDIEFEKYPGKGATIFNIFNKDTVRLQMFTLSLKNYAKVEELDVISEPTLKAGARFIARILLFRHTECDRNRKLLIWQAGKAGI